MELKTSFFIILVILGSFVLVSADEWSSFSNGSVSSSSENFTNGSNLETESNSDLPNVEKKEEVFEYSSEKKYSGEFYLIIFSIVIIIALIIFLIFSLLRPPKNRFKKGKF